MPHLDDATIHTLLDHELDSAEQRAVESHLAQCEQCAARVAEERSIVSGAEELIASLDDGREPSSGKWEAASREPEEAEPKAAAAAEKRAEPAFLQPSAEPRSKGPPVVLVPERVGVGEGRLRWPLAAAALVVIAAGAGWLVLRSSGPDAPVANLALDTISQAEADSISAAIMSAPAALPAREPTGFDSANQLAGAPAPATTARQDSAVDSPVVARAAPDPRAGRPFPADLARGVSGGGSSTADAESTRLRAEAADSARAESTQLAVRESVATAERARDSLAQLARRRAADSARQEIALRNAEEAARRDRAELALESQPPPRPAAAAAAPPREQVTTRQREQPAMRLGPIGLDEAAEQLGGPVHAIDGMRYSSLSLVPPGNLPGADPTRPVVRATYVGVDGSTIYLDQQRMLDGSGEGDTEEVFRASGWYIGSVKLRLTGDVTFDSLAVLVSKVR
jgi:hypothetical protein